jgi:hypothetical protein
MLNGSWPNAFHAHPRMRTCGVTGFRPRYVFTVGRPVRVQSGGGVSVGRSDYLILEKKGK